MAGTDHEHSDQHAGRGQRGEYAKSETRRRAIIAAAIEVFAHRGFRDGSLRDVAEGAGITHPGIRHHFPTKVELLQAVLRQREEDRSEQRRLGDAQNGLSSVTGWIEEMSASIDEPVLVELELVLAGEASSPDHPAHEYFGRLHAETEEMLSRAFQAMRDHGQLREDIDPALAARSMLACARGAQHLWLRDGSIDVGEVLQAQLAAFRL
ncbi:TetR/AcrR family transcriptional regulator [Nocardia thailandica]